MITVICSDVFFKHSPINKKYERPSRIKSILNAIDRGNFSFDRINMVNPISSSIGFISYVHTLDYILDFRNSFLLGKSFFCSDDCLLDFDTYDVALQASGSVILAIDMVMNGNAQKVFCAVRPPGHHAGFTKARGFCFFNNVAIAARYIQRRYGIRKVFILDWDAHHGNGTQEIFYDDDDVFFCSLHEDPFSAYPGTGFEKECGYGDGVGFNLNCCFESGTRDDYYLKVFDDKVLNAIYNFQPEFILISAGFDSHFSDPLAGLNLSNYVYEYMTACVCDIANDICDGRLVSVLEGGYNLRNLKNSVLTHLNAFR